MVLIHVLIHLTVQSENIHTQTDIIFQAASSLQVFTVWLLHFIICVCSAVVTQNTEEQGS
jgi:hypothetical protein